MSFPTPDENAPNTPDRSMLESLEEIENSLRQMLLLAELSASDIDTDRSRLQAVLERLRDKIDRIADQL